MLESMHGLPERLRLFSFSSDSADGSNRSNRIGSIRKLPLYSAPNRLARPRLAAASERMRRLCARPCHSETTTQEISCRQIAKHAGL